MLNPFIYLHKGVKFAFLFFPKVISLIPSKDREFYRKMESLPINLENTTSCISRFMGLNLLFPYNPDRPLHGICRISFAVIRRQCIIGSRAHRSRCNRNILGDGSSIGR